MSTPYDLVLKGGRVVDPAAGVDAVRDVAVRAGRIAAVEPEVEVDAAREVVDVSGRLVLPGMIDTHAHVFEHAVGRFGLNPDLVGVHSGTTTVVDLGGASYMSMGAFKRFIVEPAETRIFSFISIYPAGEGHLSPEIYGAGIDVDLCIACIEANQGFVKGIKVNAEIGSMSIYGLDKIRKAKTASRATGVPLYVHFGELFPAPEHPRVPYDIDAIVPDVAGLLEPGDIMAHPFTRHPGGFVDRNGRVHPIVSEALARGVRVDVGHGSHFSFEVARKVLDAGIIPTTLGADMHGYNTRKPIDPGTPSSHPDPEMAPFGGDARFSLTHAMVELLALGLGLEEVLPMVSSRAAEGLGVVGALGTLAPGGVADVSVLADERGRWTLSDNDGNQVRAERMLQPLFCLRAGRRFDADAPILPVPRAA